MGLEDDAIVGDLSEFGKAEDLKPPGVGQNRTRPAHEAVQPAEPAHGFMTRAQVEVVGIGENNGRIDFVEEFLRRDAFHRGLGANGHKDGRRNHTVRGVNARLTSDRMRVWSGGSLRSIEKPSVSLSSIMPFLIACARIFS